MSGDEKPTPATPTPLLVEAPAMPETCVPCPLSSAALPAKQVPVMPVQSAPELV